MFRKRGFTLIELLVVVAIIALLMAILLPSLGRARSSAKTTACLANMKGIGTAMMVYTVEYQNRYPASVLWGGQSFDTTIRTCLGAPSIDTVTSDNFGAGMHMFQCPEDTTTRSPGTFKRSYAMNDRLWDGGPGYNTRGYIPAASIADTGGTILLSEWFIPYSNIGASGYALATNPIWGWPDASSYNFRYHSSNTRGNVLWFDGHASSEIPASIKQTANGSDYVDYQWDK